LSGATRNLTSPHTGEIAELWEPDSSDIKTYPHFDGHLSTTEIRDLVRDAGTVTKHTFYPLLHFEKKWRRAPVRRADGTLEKRKPKSRPIRYACRRDAYIYKHYRQLISVPYEAQLVSRGLADSVLAYRRIPVAAGSAACKSNIHFAKEAFEKIKALGKCSAVAIDISSFFDSLNHEKLKALWCEICGFDRLPADHFAVFKSLTAYRFVHLNDALFALGYSSLIDGVLRYNQAPWTIPPKLCSPADYREKIILPRLVHKHDKNYGIPQGTPISDVLANLFLIEFDVEMANYARKRGGHYFRYSDDILLILPGDGRAATGAVRSAVAAIQRVGNELVINPTKTEVVCYTPEGTKRCYALKLDGDRTTRIRKSENEGLAYLGFRFDGRNVYLRNSTISNLRGKVARACKAVAYQHVNGHKEKSLDWLVENAPVEKLKQQYLQVRDFDETVHKAVLAGDSAFSVMTFWSYAQRAVNIFKDDGTLITHQLRNINAMIRQQLESAIREKHAVKQATAAAA
jgi:hypothetical protein